MTSLSLSLEELRTCSRRFGPLIGAAFIGTVGGMAVLDNIPAGPLRVGHGVLTMGFVATAKRRIRLPEWPSDGTNNFSQTRLGMVGVGGISGFLFGGTNVGVQHIAYLHPHSWASSQPILHSTGDFVGQKKLSASREQAVLA